MKTEITKGVRLIWIDRAARMIMVAGVAMLLQPWWKGGFRWGFFIAAAGTILHVITSHWQLEDEE